jgi:hypothetical protein
VDPFALCREVKNHEIDVALADAIGNQFLTLREKPSPPRIQACLSGDMGKNKRFLVNSNSWRLIIRPVYAFGFALPVLPEA